jgi:hypothetical protein
MSEKNFWSSRMKESAVLSPIDRVSEVLFGLVMVLTFTGTVSATHPGKAELRDLLWSALGCNLAWGIIDAMMYLMNIILSRAYGLWVIKRIMNSNDAQVVREIIKEELDPVVASLLKDDEFDNLGRGSSSWRLQRKKTYLPSEILLRGFRSFYWFFCARYPWLSHLC